jgi:tetratricopeptide (TPR) repeat protein
MLVTIQQFASNRLRQMGIETEARDNHLSHFLALAEKGDRELRGPRQGEWADRIHEEQNNMRAALEWAVSSRKTEAAVRLLCALGWPWEIRGHYSEAQNWLDRIRALPDVNKYPSPLSRILSHIGRYHWTQDRFHEAHLLFMESKTIAAQMGEEGERELANALNWLALHQIGNDNDNARKALEQSLELSAKHGDEWEIALSTFHLGILEAGLQHTDAALSLLEKSLALFHRFGDLFFISRVSIFLGYLFMNQGRYDRARQLFERHLQIDTQLHFWDGIASGWLNLGNLARQQGEKDQAQAYYEQARTIGREHGLSVRNLPEQIL